MKGLVIKRNGDEIVRLGLDDGLLLVMFNHVDNERFSLSELYVSVTEYATGDRYGYVSEKLRCGDAFEITYAEFEEASAPLKLAKKGERPLRRPQRQEFEKQAFDKEEDEPMPVFLEGNSRLKGFEIDFNGEIVRGAVPTGAGVYISSQIDHLRASLLGTTREGVSCRWFSRMFMPGDRLKVKFDEFPVETLSVPMKVNFD